ncbi:complement C1q tumor necrosis factor-related protein 3-like [Saccostrea cucullata]|uniref:complement C1q tumor necrosis factor-related protein 3-like n=1 Tax=Saccostrea cuccullata TaxID=36930 RepID=UPI002ED46C7F
MSHDESSLGQHQTIIFDHVITNVGGYYNRHMGIFSSPVNGVYTFSWTLYCISDGYIYSEIVVNSNAAGAMYCDGQGALSLRHTTGVVVVEINLGDVVYIRTHPQDPVGGAIPSCSTYPSSFKGWKLY